MRAIPRKCYIFLALIIAVTLCVLLVVKCNKGNEADIEIAIGRPVEAAETAVDFTNSPKLSPKTTDHLLFALLASKALPDQAVPNTPPDAIIMIRNGGVAHMYSAWIDGRDLIYTMQTDEEATDYRVATLSGDERSLFEGVNNG